MGDRWFEDISAWESGSLPWDQRPLHVRVCCCTDGAKCALGCVCVVVTMTLVFCFFLRVVTCR